MLPWQGENEEHAIRILIQGNFKLFQHPFQFHDKTIRSMHHSHLQRCKGTSISDLTHKNKLFRELKLFYSKLKEVGQILMKTKIDFILNVFFFLGEGGRGEGGNSKKTSFKFQELSTSILLVYCNARSMRLYIWCFCLRRQNLLLSH